MNTLRCEDSWFGIKAGAGVVALVLFGAVGGAATAASLDGGQRGAGQADFVLAQAAPVQVTQTVWMGLVSPGPSERAAVAMSPETALPSTDQEHPSPGAMVLAVIGLALWVVTRLRRED